MIDVQNLRMVQTVKKILFIILISPIYVLADSPESDLRKIISDVELGWENANGAPFKKHFLDFPGARYFESGGQNIGLDDLIDHHVVPEGQSIKLELTFTNHQFNINDGFAWVLVDTEVRGEVVKSGRSFHNKGFQTFIFQNLEETWRVVHTHSSSRPIK